MPEIIWIINAILPIYLSDSTFWSLFTSTQKIIWLNPVFVSSKSANSGCLITCLKWNADKVNKGCTNTRINAKKK